MIQKQIHIRISILFFLFVTLYALVVVNLFIIQIKNAHFFESMGQSQYAVTFVARPPRALIYDRHGIPLAINSEHTTLFVTPKNIKQPTELIRFLKRHFPNSIERLHKNTDAHFMYIKRRLTPTELALVEKSNLPDLYLMKEADRFYPVPGLGPIIGTTNIDNDGLFGIELTYNDQLQGSPSTYLLEQEGRTNHFYFKKETKIQGKPGTPLHLTIDSKLQFLVYDQLKEHVTNWHAEEGSVIIMNPDNGDILVMANYPDVDPNATEITDLALTKNKIITEVYEFGSVMKTFPAIAALAEGIVTPDEIIDCENTKTTFINGMRVNTWKAHDKLTYDQVVELSNNIGTAKVTLRIGNKLYDHLQRFGFGKKTGLNFSGEQKGFINPPAQWSKASLLSLSFGYEMNATLLQLACAYSMISREGSPIKPRLVATEHTDTNQKKLYPASVMQTIRDILTKTVTQGTAHKAHIDGYTIMGKTGTANMLEQGEYNPDSNIFTFAGIIEKDTYRRVIVVFIKKVAQKNVYASTVSVPLFETIAQKMLIHDKVI